MARPAQAARGSGHGWIGVGGPVFRYMANERAGFRSAAATRDDSSCLDITGSSVPVSRLLTVYPGSHAVVCARASSLVPVLEAPKMIGTALAVTGLALITREPPAALFVPCFGFCRH